MSTNKVGGKSYEEFLQSIRARGLGTTSINNGEANFADYANALSSSLKEEILQSMGDEAGDKALQAKVASLMNGSSIKEGNAMISAAKAAGLQCRVEYRQTSYIVDNKADGNYHKNATQGAIAVYTFSDGTSTIKVADANGNGSLEAEEIFLNEILGDVTNDISASGNVSGNAANSALDTAKLQQQMLLKEIEDSKKAQQEELDKLDKLNNAFEDDEEQVDEEDAKETDASKEQNEQSISKKQAEDMIIEQALSDYDGYNSGSIKAVERALDKVADNYDIEIDASQIDTISLAKDYAKETAKIDEENAPQEEPATVQEEPTAQEEPAIQEEAAQEESIVQEEPVVQEKPIVQEEAVIQEENFFEPIEPEETQAPEEENFFKPQEPEVLPDDDNFFEEDPLKRKKEEI